MQEAETVLFQNLNDVGNARMYMRALVAMQEGSAKTDSVFLILASQGMTNDMFSRLMRVLDRTKRTGTFWYLHKHDKRPESWISSQDLEYISESAKKLKHARNKSHFHIDKEYAYDSSRAWKEADFSGINIQRTIETLYGALSRKFEQVTGYEFDAPEYDGEDAKVAVRLILGTKT